MNELSVRSRYAHGAALLDGSTPVMDWGVREEADKLRWTPNLYIAAARPSTREPWYDYGFPPPERSSGSTCIDVQLPAHGVRVKAWVLALHPSSVSRSLLSRTHAQPAHACALSLTTAAAGATAPQPAHLKTMVTSQPRLGPLTPRSRLMPGQRRGLGCKED